MGQIVARSTSRERFNTLLMSVFALSALALAAIGIYGVMAYAVRQRTREIGVRVALGADRSNILALIFGSGARLILLGAVIGVVCALALGQYLSSVLFEVSPRDVSVYVLMSLALVLAAGFATLIPALQATRLDPLKAIRYE
jgi:ABC-type antimicrobial peptide transport system permease subunit